MSDSGNTVLGVLAGTVIGATLGIMFAPDKGATTRKKIMEQAETARDQMAEHTDELRDRAAATVAAKSTSLENQLESIVSDASHKTDDVITTLEKKLATLKTKNKKLQKS